MQVMTVRGLFAAVLVVLPVQMAVARGFGEPYPALYMPSFATPVDAGGTATSLLPHLQVTFADGTTATVAMEELLQDVGTSPHAAFATVFDDDQRADDPRTVAWLRERIEHVTGRSPRGDVVVVWQRTAWPRPGAPPTTTVERTRVIPLGDAP